MANWGDSSAKWGDPFVSWDGASLLTTKTVNDPVGVSDVVSARPGRVVGPDQVGILDTSNPQVIATVYTIDDPVGLHDAVVAGALNIGRFPADMVGVDDTVGSATVFPRALNETVGVDDTLVDSEAVTRALGDAVGVSDATTDDAVRTRNDPVGVSDLVTVTSTSGELVSDAVGVTDTVALVRTASLSVVDPVGITDSTTAGAVNLSRSVSDPVGVTDVVSDVPSSGRTVADPVGVTDTRTPVLTVQRLLGDAVGVHDAAASGGLGGNRLIDDTVDVLDDARVTHRDTTLLIADPVGVIDHAGGGRPGEFDDVVNVSDEILSVRKRPPRGDQGILFGPEAVLSGNRLTRFRFDLLDNDENLLGELEGVQPTGYVEWSYSTAIHGMGMITVSDLGQDIDWLNVRIRPVIIVHRLGGNDDPRGIETPLGVFLANAPVEKWTDTGRVWDVELLDKCSILDQDITIDQWGDPFAYSVGVGMNIIDDVIELIELTGETAPAIEPNDKLTSHSLVWDIGATRLKIVDGLLDAAGYFSLWCDGKGQYQATLYSDPANRVPVYESLLPFTKSELSLMAPDWTHDRDLGSIPNRYVAISQGDGTTEALTAVATNTDPLSPYSFQNRGDGTMEGGRWITRTITDVEAVSLAELQTIAKRGLTSTTSVTSAISLSHAFLPDLRVNSGVRFVNPDAGLDMLCYVTQTRVPFDPVALCTSEFREAMT